MKNFKLLSDNKTTINFNESVKEEAPATSIGNASVALPPTARFKTINVTDRRRRKDKEPLLLKRFRKYMDDQRDA